MKKYITLMLATIIVCACAAQEKVSAPDKPGFWRSVANFFLPHHDTRQILLEKQTLYFLVTVEKGENGWRHLVFNPNRGSQGIWNPESPDELLSNYCKYTTLFMQGIDQYPRKVLFIGLGAGVMPRFVRKRFPATAIDVIEIDAEIPGVAEQYFGFRKDAGINVTVGDGRDFINRNKEKYDIIFIDAYNAGNIPFQLTTEEFFRKVRESLTPGGIMTANVANLGKPNFISSELKTVQSVFPDLAVFVCPEQSNYMLFAPANRKFDSSEVKIKCREIEETSNPELDFKDMLGRRMSDEELKKITSGAMILKDDFAPVETM
ncbi:MAG: spermidine synthase, partial [Victivallaceae bacterium]